MAVTTLGRTLGKLNVVELAKANTPAEFKKAALKSVGDTRKVLSLNGSEVLVATYIEPEVTAGGIYKPQKTTEEARFQGKIGLVLQLGPTSFKYVDGGYAYEGPEVKEGDFVVFHPSAPREISIRGTSCKIIKSELIWGIARDPEQIY